MTLVLPALLWAAAVPTASAQYTLHTLATFDTANGASPTAGLIADPGGNLYGTTQSGGTTGNGTVFELAAGTHALSTLVSFDGANGTTPFLGRLLADASGNLFGTAAYGGANNQGTVFALAAGTHALTTLTTFDYTNGGGPSAGLIADGGGNLYSTTQVGGTNGKGTVFEVAAGSHALTTLATFNGTNGAFPYAGLIADASGNLFGTTNSGGTNNQGTVYELTAGTHALSTLATFNGTNGAFPIAGLIADASGNLYGTTDQGGANSAGTVFEIAAGTHALITLASLDTTNGANPWAGLFADASGNLYGTTAEGGANDQGTVFELVAVPEPSGIALALSGVWAVGAMTLRRRRRGT
jgi:uncharacterized repeat protein (TIGR03803 family)